MKSVGIKRIFSVILLFGVVVFSSPGAGNAFLRKIDVLFNKISTPLELIRAGKSFNRIEKVGIQIHKYSKEKEQIGDYRSQKIINSAEAKYAAGQFSTVQRDSEIKRAKTIRNAYYEYARQIRRYGRSAGRYETRRALEPIANIALRSKKAGHAFQKGYEVLNNGKQALQTIRGEIDKALELVGSKSNTAIARLQRIRDKLNRHADNLEIAYEATQAIGIRGRAIDHTLGDGGALARALSEEVGDVQNRIRNGEQNIREFGERLKKQAEKTETRLTRAEERLRQFKEKGFDTEVRRDRYSLAQFRERMKDKKDILERRSQIARLMAARSGLETDAEADLPKLTDTTEGPSSLPKLTDSTEDPSSPFGDSTRSTEDMLARRKDTHAAQLADRRVADSTIEGHSTQQALQQRVKKTQSQIEEDARIKAQKDAEKKARDRAVATAVDKRESMIAELKTLQAQGIDINFDEGMNSKELEKILADARRRAEQLKNEKEEEEKEAARKKAEEDKNKEEEKRLAEARRKEEEEEKKKKAFPRTYTGQAQLMYTAQAAYGNMQQYSRPLTIVVKMTLDGAGKINGTIAGSADCWFDDNGNFLKFKESRTEDPFSGTYGNGILNLGSIKGNYDQNDATLNVDHQETNIVEGKIIFQTLKGTLKLPRKK